MFLAMRFRRIDEDVLLVLDPGDGRAPGPAPRPLLVKGRLASFHVKATIMFSRGLAR
jgi:hypothetical protein